MEPMRATTYIVGHLVDTAITVKHRTVDIDIIAIVKQTMHIIAVFFIPFTGDKKANPQKTLRFALTPGLGIEPRSVIESNLLLLPFSPWLFSASYRIIV